MDRPIKTTHEAYDFHDCTDYIEKKYSITTRDYAGKYKHPTHFEKWCAARGFPKIDEDGVHINSSQKLYAAYRLDPEGEAKENELPYLDFWHWILDRNEIHNGCLFYLDRYALDEEGEEYQEEQWVKDILELYFKEFGVEGEDEIEFWVSW